MFQGSFFIIKTTTAANTETRKPNQCLMCSYAKIIVTASSGARHSLTAGLKCYYKQAGCSCSGSLLTSIYRDAYIQGIGWDRFFLGLIFAFFHSFICGGAVAQVAEHWTVTQKVMGLNLTRAGSWKAPPVPPAASGYLTLVGEG